MRFCARQARAELAFFSWFCATRRAANRQCLFLFDFHGYTVHGCSSIRWSIVTTAKSCAKRIMSLLLQQIGLRPPPIERLPARMARVLSRVRHTASAIDSLHVSYLAQT